MPEFKASGNPVVLRGYFAVRRDAHSRGKHSQISVHLHSMKIGFAQGPGCLERTGEYSVIGRRALARQRRDIDSIEALQAASQTKRFEIVNFTVGKNVAAESAHPHAAKADLIRRSGKFS